MLQAAAGAAGGSDTYWISAIYGTSDLVVYGVAVDSDDNIIAAGNDNGRQTLVVKWDSEGTVQWQTNLTGYGYHDPYGIAVDSSGNSYVATKGDVAGTNTDFFVVKLDADGALVWEYRFKYTGNDSMEEPGDIAVDSSDNIYFSGYGYVPDYAYDGYLVKLNSSGTIQWQKRIHEASSSNEYQYIHGLALDSSSNVYVVGRSPSSTGYIIKFNSSGTKQWDKGFAGSQTARFRGVTVDSSGNPIAVGEYQANSTVYGLVVKYNSSGTVQWQRRVGETTGYEYFYRVATDSDDNIYVCGYTASEGEGAADALIVKYDSSGTLQWQKIFGTTGGQYWRSVTTNSFGTPIVGGEDSFVVAKLPPDGSGDGTYTVGGGSWVYQDSTLTSATLSESTSTPNKTVSTAGLVRYSTSYTENTRAYSDSLDEITS